MKNLNRALRMALRYRWSIAGSVVCSLLVAVFWGINLGAVYPFVEVILHNKTLHQWAGERIEAGEATVLRLENRAAAGGPDGRPLTGRELQSLRTGIENENQRIATTRSLLVWIERYAPTDPWQTLLWVVAFLLFATVMRGLFLVGSMVLVARVGQRTMLDLQNRVFDNVLEMELNEVGVQGTGDLVTRIRGETSVVGVAITNLFGKTLREPLKMAACLAGAAWINWRLLLFSLLVAPAAIALMLVLARSTKRANRRASEESARLLDRLYQSLTYLRVVKAFVMEDSERNRFQHVANDVYRRSMKISWYGALARVNNEVLGISVIGLAVLAGGYLVLNQETRMLGIRLSGTAMGFGEIMTFFAFMCGVADPLRKMADVFGSLQAGIVAADRVFPLIDQVPQIRDPARPRNLPAGGLSLDFDSVSFAYDASRPILRRISFSVPAGTSLAIIGPNGCGKSTLVNLVPRFFDAQSGAIRVGGIDVRELGLRGLRERIGYVTQQTMLFSDTVAGNIRYGTPAAGLPEVISAARRAHADRFIEELPEGYETQVGEHGNRLSGGQRQRLTLARAILRDPDILLLDEATSQIDPHSERLIQQTLAAFIRNRTTLVVTHRMETLDLVDRIMVMDEGRIVDLGTHGELLQRCAIYRHLRETRQQEAA